MCFRKFGVVDMIKLNRIGNKLGLAGAVGVMLAIGMVANQMVTESKIEGSSERAARSQQVANNALAAHIDLRKIQLAAATSGWRELAPKSKRTVADLQRHKASAAKETGGGAGNSPDGRKPRNSCRRPRL